MNFTVNDFFCGAGGMGLGFKQAGFTIVGAWDFDKYAVQSYRENVGDHVKQADITQMTAADVPYADVWTAGFPCQDLSIANMKGKDRKKLNGEKSRLFFEVMRLLDEVQEKPNVIVAENVEELGDLLPIVEEHYRIRGYKMYAKLFNSKDWNVAQNRPRYFVVGIRNGEFTFPTQLNNSSVALVDFLETDIPEKYFYTDKDYEHYDGMKIVPGKLNQIGKLRVAGWLDYMTRVYSVEGLAPTLHTCQGGHRQAKIFDPVKKLPRKLTPREYARLQGFPDDFKFVVSNTQLYKQFGNAVSVPVAKAIAEKLKEVL